MSSLFSTAGRAFGAKTNEVHLSTGSRKAKVVLLPPTKSLAPAVQVQIRQRNGMFQTVAEFRLAS